MDGDCKFKIIIVENGCETKELNAKFFEYLYVSDNSENLNEKIDCIVDLILTK